MSNAITPIGSSISVATTSTVAVSNVAVGTNTFRITNANDTVYAYVNVFKSYADAAAMTSTGGIVLAPKESVLLAGNFGIQPNPGTVYVATITSTGSTTVIATPIAP